AVEHADRHETVDARKPDIRVRVAADRDRQRLRGEVPREAADVGRQNPVSVIVHRSVFAAAVDSAAAPMSCSSYRLLADHADRLGLASGHDRERPADVAIAVARADRGVVAGPELDLMRREDAEPAYPIERDLGQTVRHELNAHRRRRDRHELLEPRDLTVEPRL